MLNEDPSLMHQRSSNSKFPMPIWKKTQYQGHLFATQTKRSKRVKKATNWTFDALRHGFFRKPSRSRNPYVRVAFLPQNDNFKTLPI